jgi:hypothetical protein
MHLAHTPEHAAWRHERRRCLAAVVTPEVEAEMSEALTYKNLLLRVQARIVKDPAQQQKLLAEAKQYEAQAAEVRKKQSAATPSGAE